MKHDPNSHTFRAAQLGVILARHYPEASPYAVAATVDMMQRATKYAKQFSTMQCDYDLGDPDDSTSGHARRQRYQDKAQDQINNRLASIDLADPDNRHRTEWMHPNAATVSLGGDCRGPCGRLAVPGERGDGWGEGFAIY